MIVYFPLIASLSGNFLSTNGEKVLDEFRRNLTIKGVNSVS
jgi:hypothetical protein